MFTLFMSPQVFSGLGPFMLFRFLFFLGSALSVHVALQCYGLCRSCPLFFGQLGCSVSCLSVVSWLFWMLEGVSSCCCCFNFVQMCPGCFE